MAYTSGPMWPCNPATARSETTKLSVDPKGEKLVYTNGRAVIIRDLNNPAQATSYTQHTQAATVARISPSGYYCASADVAGNVRIWDVAGSDQILKLATRPLAGKVHDLAWDGESKRIVAVGEGRDKFGAAFMFDSGSSVGEITGHAKTITSVAIRQQRPFRAVTGSDDCSIVLSNGVPFKYSKPLATHTRFVRDVAYSPNGDLFASVGSDGKLFLYEGKEGEVKAEMDVHKGSAMACSWSPDSLKITTAGVDGVVAIWDATSQQESQRFTIGSDLDSQQNGVVWANPNTIVSASLSGTLNVFDIRENSTWRKLYGPTKAVTSATFEPKSQTFYTGSFDGSTKGFSTDGECFDVPGGHSARISGMSHDAQGRVHTAAWDDKVAVIDGQKYTDEAIPSHSQPLGVASTSNAVYVATASGIEVHPGGKQGGASKAAKSASAVAAWAGPDGDIVAYGSGPDNKKVSLALASGQELKTDAEFDDNRGEILALAFSPDGAWLAAGDATGRITLIDVKQKTTIISSRWTFHSGRIGGLAFSPNSKRLVSGGLDESIYIWSTEKQMKNIVIKNAHPGGVAGVAWSKDNTGLLSTGADGCVRSWTVAE